MIAFRFKKRSVEYARRVYWPNSFSLFHSVVYFKLIRELLYMQLRFLIDLSAKIYKLKKMKPVDSL